MQNTCRQIVKAMKHHVYNTIAYHQCITTAKKYVHTMKIQVSTKMLRDIAANTFMIIYQKIPAVKSSSMVCYSNQLMQQQKSRAGLKCQIGLQVTPASSEWEQS